MKSYGDRNSAKKAAKLYIRTSEMKIMKIEKRNH